MSVKISEPINGAILNRHDGKVTPEGLEITVKGNCSSGAKVTVNGRPAVVAGEEFTATACLDKQQENTITAEAEAAAPESRR